MVSNSEEVGNDFTGADLVSIEGRVGNLCENGAFGDDAVCKYRDVGR